MMITDWARCPSCGGQLELHIPGDDDWGGEWVHETEERP